MKINLSKVSNGELVNLLGNRNCIKLNEELEIMVTGWSIDITNGNRSIVRGRKNVIKYLKENNLEIIIEMKEGK